MIGLVYTLSHDKQQKGYKRDNITLTIYKIFNAVNAFLEQVKPPHILQKEINRSLIEAIGRIELVK